MRLRLLLWLWRARSSVVLRLGLTRWFGLAGLRLRLGSFGLRLCSFRLRCAAFRSRRRLCRPVVLGRIRTFRRCVVSALGRLRLSYLRTRFALLLLSLLVFAGLLLLLSLLLLLAGLLLLFSLLLFPRLLVFRRAWNILLAACLLVRLRCGLGIGRPVYSRQARSLRFWRSECSRLWCGYNCGATCSLGSELTPVIASCLLLLSLR